MVVENTSKYLIHIDYCRFQEHKNQNMFKSKKFIGKLVKKPSEVVDDDFYEDDFENFVYDDDFTIDTDVSVLEKSMKRSVFNQ